MPDNTWDHTFRRIVTSHHESDTDGSKVQIYDDTLPMRSVLDGDAHMTPLFASLDVPTKSAHHILAPSVVTPNGTNGQVTDLAPGAKVGMHRTNSIDYNVILKGSVWLVTPSGDGKEERVKVHAGEVVVQRGTIHAWEATEEGARWCTVIVSALPVEVGGKALEEVDF
jgi:quercetin dioxygenase-like cupin family protein